MLAKKYFSVVKSISNPFEGIYTIVFESLGRPYKFHAGQFLHLAIDADYDDTGQWPESRCFSMQSSPDLKDITITYAVKGKFTSEMEKVLKPGIEVWLKLPYGDLFMYQHDKNNTVFIAGGTGVTPFLSLFTGQEFNNYSNYNIYLGFRSSEYNIYQEELKNIIPENLHIAYEDRDGQLNIASIYEAHGNIASYFISGPPAMIKIFKQYLIGQGVKAENVLTDDWE